jgi:hypothetical protein
LFLLCSCFIWIWCYCYCYNSSSSCSCSCAQLHPDRPATAASRTPPAERQVLRCDWRAETQPQRAERRGRVLHCAVADRSLPGHGFCRLMLHVTRAQWTCTCTYLLADITAVKIKALLYRSRRRRRRWRRQGNARQGRLTPHRHHMFGSALLDLLILKPPRYTYFPPPGIMIGRASSGPAPPPPPPPPPPPGPGPPL